MITNREIALYTLRLLDSLRGEAGKTQLNTMIYDRFDDGEDENRREEFVSQTRQVVDALVELGYIRSSSQGYHLIHMPEMGEVTEEQIANEIKRIRRRTKEEEQERRDEEFKKVLLDTLRKMDDRNFEYLIAKLMRVCGFEFFPGQGTADDGVDGEGYYTVNEVLRYKVIVQCKRYEDGHTIGNKYIRDLRGAVSTKAHKGLFVTTSTYTRNARAEAAIHPLIDLLDGNDLTELIFRHKLGIEQDADGNYKLSEAYFDRYGFRKSF